MASCNERSPTCAQLHSKRQPSHLTASVRRRFRTWTNSALVILPVLSLCIRHTSAMQLVFNGGRKRDGRQTADACHACQSV